MDEIDYLAEQNFPYDDEIATDGGEVLENDLEEQDSVYEPMAGVAITTAAVAAGTYGSASQEALGNLSGEAVAAILGGAAIISGGIAVADYLEH